MKTCTRCQQPKPDSEFSPRTYQSGKVGLTSWCKQCHREHAKAKADPATTRSKNVAYYWANRDRERARSARWQAANRTPERRRQWNLARRGMTPQSYDQMLAAQNHGCAVCSTAPETQRYGRLVVDHDHATGAIRGLLCNPCNQAIGLMRDDPDLLVTLAQYLDGDLGTRGLKLA